MSAFPLTYAHQNVLFGHGGARAALYRLETVSYPFLPAADKREWLRRLARLAFAVGADLSLWRVCCGYPAETYAERGAGAGDGPAWAEYLRSHEPYLRGLASFEPELYLAVSLAGARPTGPGAAVMAASARARGRLADLARLSRPLRVGSGELEALVAAEERAHQRVTAALPSRRATTRELQWLLRRAPCRGVGEPLMDDHWRPNALVVEAPGGRVAYEPLETCLLRHGNAAVAEGERHLVVEAEEGTGHQATLALGALPEEARFPGDAELLCLPLEALPFPVDAVVHARWLGNREALARVRRRVVDADVAYSDEMVSAHGPLSYTTEENRRLARELDAYLKTVERPPLLEVAVSLAVGAPDPEELERRVEAVRHQCGGLALHRPVGLQGGLWMDHLPRPDGGRVRDYADVLTVEQFGALVPAGTHRAGSAGGAYFGRTASGAQRPVRFDAREASRADRPPTVPLAGTLGSGKTVAAELLALQAALGGSAVVTVDPKPDHALHALPQLAGRVHVMELSGEDRYRGELDPLVVAPPAVREDLAASYLMDLLPTAPPAWSTQVRKAVRAALADPEPCLMGALRHLRQQPGPDAAAAHEALEVWSDSGVARLGFSGGGRPPSASAQVTTIRAQNLALPEPGVARADYDQAERLGVATLKLLAAYAMRLVQGDRARHKLLLFDEAWFLVASADGRRLLDRLVRMSRTENATLLLSTQHLGDVGDLEALVGTRMVFGHETAAGARAGLELLGLDPGDRQLVERVRSYRRGRCLMRDVHGQVAEVQVDLADPGLLHALDTSPRARAVAA